MFKVMANSSSINILDKKKKKKLKNATVYLC